MEGDHWGDPGVDKRIILIYIFKKWDMGVWTGLGLKKWSRGVWTRLSLKKWDMGVWTGLSWLRIETGDGRL
jgi:hypothetical protein